MQRQTAKAAYKLRVRQAFKEEKVSYYNDSHDALLSKSGNDFWKSWHSKGGDNKATPRQVNGVTNDKIIVSNFAEYFNMCCSPNSAERSDIIYSKYANLCQNYCGLPCTDEQVGDAALVDKIIRSLKNGKAAGLDSLTTEHLKYAPSHLPPSLLRFLTSCLFLAVYRLHSIAVTPFLYRRAAMQSENL